MTRAVLAIAVSTVLSVTLVGAYVALGESTAAAPIVDPCTPREWRSTSGIEATIEQIVLLTADEAACDLDVSREELLLALGGGSDLDEFAAEHNVTLDRAEAAIRGGLRSAVDDAEEADAIGGTTALLLRQLPIGVLLTVLANSPEVFR